MTDREVLLKIEGMIYIIRGQNVMLDSDLAVLYGVETKRLNEQVRRNLSRFPKDFMFQLTHDEYENLKSQIATSSSDWGGKRKQPLVFTELGVAMLSSVLNSEQAISINISIMRIFTKLRSYIALEQKLSEQIEDLESSTNKMFKVVFERMDEYEEILNPRLPSNRRKIGLVK